jgi:succinate-semialdehyde dehydrogenase / glutarate-semialdehyde dehydrogenase
MHRVIDPATGRELRAIPNDTPATVDAALAAAVRVQAAWSRTGFEERAAVIRKAASLLRDRTDRWAGLMAEEMGKPLAQGRNEVEKCAWVCDYYAERAAGFLADAPVEVEGARAYVAYRPLGVVLSIMPWNFPFWQVFRFAAPALMAGNAVLLKHASNVPGCAGAIEGLFRLAGAPDGLLTSLYLDREQVGDLIDRPEVAAVTLTGSTGAGRAVAARAGRALKKTVLELGGSDPYLVLEDAELEQAVEACAAGRLVNSGQSCVAAKRFIVVESLRADFEARLVARMGAAKMGPPTEEGVEVGPQAREDLRDELHDQVRRSVEKGARLLLGGQIPERDGWYYPPTVLTDVAPGQPAWEEELFGPVAAVIAVTDEAEAIRVANDSVFGLGGAVFTSDPARGERIARDELQVGCAFVNDQVKSHPALPFGGVKESGYGRELGPFGIREFVNVKTVWVAGG